MDDPGSYLAGISRKIEYTGLLKINQVTGASFSKSFDIFISSDFERRDLMSYDFNGPYGQELRSMADVLELINYRRRTYDSYLYAISLCCEWLDQTYHISIDKASVSQLREHLTYLKKPKAEGGRGFAPRSVNISNCAIKRYFQFVLGRPLERNDAAQSR